MLYTFLFSIGSPAINSIMSQSFKLELFLSLIIGLNIGIPFTYYFLNHKSFKPVPFVNGIVISVIGLIPSGILAFLVVYFLPSFVYL